MSPLDVNEVGSVGLDGAHVLSLAEDQFDSLSIDWQPGMSPPGDVLSFAFGQPIAVHDASQSATSASDACQAVAWVDVEVPVTLAASSGELSGSGVVSVRAVSGGELYLVGMQDSLSLDLSGDYLATVASAGGGATLDSAHLSLGWGGIDPTAGLNQVVGIGGSWADGSGGSVGSVYVCRTGETDCLSVD